MFLIEYFLKKKKKLQRDPLPCCYSYEHGPSHGAKYIYEIIVLIQSNFHESLSEGPWKSWKYLVKEQKCFGMHFEGTIVETLKFCFKYDSMKGYPVMKHQRMEDALYSVLHLVTC